MIQNTTKAVSVACYHCGEDCNGVEIEYDDKPFCCSGCKSVYSILKENDLCDYYALNSSAGISFKRTSQEQYSHLDKQDVIDRIVDFKDGKFSRVHFYLPQIHCSSCLWLLENLNRIEPAIFRSRVNFLKKEITVLFQQESISLRSLVELLASLGYRPVLNYEKLSESKSQVVDRSLYYKLGVAGFAFGNIMMLSFPEYLGIDPEQDFAFVKFFGYLIFFLALPVVFYCGRDYLKSAWHGIRNGHLNIDVPISLGILALFGRSSFEILTQSGAGYFDSLAGLIFFLLIGKWFQQKVYHTISFDRDYRSYFPMASTAIRNGTETAVPIDQLVPGDKIIIRSGELVPADSHLLKGSASLDYSFVTGESNLITPGIGDKIFAGGRQMGGTLTLSIISQVSQSYLTSLWNDELFKKDVQEGRVSTISDQVARFFTAVILTVAVLTLIYWITIDPSLAVNAFTAVLIIACPCAVALSIPFTFGNTMRILGRHHFYLKNTSVIEAIAGVNHIIFDKTGTITTAPGRKLRFVGQKLTLEECDLIRTLVHQSSHPLSRQIESFLEDDKILEVSDFKSFPGLGIRAKISGHLVHLGNARFIGLDTDKSDSGTWVKIDELVKGKFLLDQEYRKGLRTVLDRWRSRYKLSLLSGDDPAEMSRLQAQFPEDSLLYFRQSPHDKLTFVKERQTRGERIMMIGDGLNDAGALKGSDVGLVVTGQVGNFIPACDAVLEGQSFEKLPDFFRFIDQSINVVFWSYGIALVYNVIGLTFAVQGLLKPVVAAILMPLSSVTIVLFGVGLSTILARNLKRRDPEVA